MTTNNPSIVLCPFTILIDQREKAPYRFTGLRADSSRQYRPLDVPTRWVHLPTGDYSIDGMSDLVCVERKSLADLYTTLGQHRERFEAEHQRMAAMAFAAVVVESDLAAAIAAPPPRSKLHPRAVYRTWLAWMVKYGVPWLWIGSREGAEKTTFQLLRMFWKQHEERKHGTGRDEGNGICGCG